MRTEKKYDHISEFHQGVAIVVKDDKYGAILVGGHEIISPSYDYISSFNEGYAQAIRKGECRILDLSGRECKRYSDKLIAIPSKYDEVREFKDGYACVKLNGLWGAIDMHGNEIFEPQFYYLSDFVGGSAKYKKEKTDVSNSWGYVHADGYCSACNMYEPILEEDGNIIIKRYINSRNENVRINKEGQLVVKNGNTKVTLPDGFILARDFSYGLARVQDSTGYWGYVNLEGKIIIPLEYTEALGFYENRAFVCDKNDKWCLISTNGSIIKSFDNISFPFQFEKGYSIARTNDDKHVILDLNGSAVSQYFDGLVSHTDKSNEFEIDHNGLKGYYNVTTKLCIEPRFEKILEVHKDYVKIEVQNIGEVFADFAGRVFIEGSPRIYVPDWCLGAKSLTDEIYLGISKDKKYGLIGSKGETLCEPVIEDISEVDGDIVVIERFCKKKAYISSDGTFKYGLYDIKKKVLIPADYDTRPELKDGYYLISKNGLFGILDLNGQQILKPEWKSISPFDGCFLVRKVVDDVDDYSKHLGLVNKSGNFLIKPDYNEIVILAPGIYKAKRCGLWTIYDKDGKLTEESFDEVTLDGDTFIVKSCGRDYHLDIRRRIVLSEDGTYVELPSKFRWGYDVNDGIERVDVFSSGRDVQCQNHVDTLFNIVLNDNGSIASVDDGVDYIYERNLYGIYTYMSGHKYGLLSSEGKILVKAGYDNIRTISKDLYIASIKDGHNMKRGVIDVNGNVCIQPGYEDIQKTEYGFILKNGNKYGYATLDYSIICEPKYASIEEVGNGFKRVSISNFWGELSYGIMDQSGKECLEPRYISIGNINDYGEAEIIAPGMKYGTVDSNYNIIKEPSKYKLGTNILKYESAAEGLVWIREKDTEKIGLATEEGKILIEPRFGKVEAFVNGYAKVNTGYWHEEEYNDEYDQWKVIRVYVDGKWGVIDISGHTVVPAKYSSIQIEEDGTFKVFSEGHSVRLNRAGKRIVKNVVGDYIPALKKYDWQSDFDTNGYSEVYYKGKVGVVNDKFQLIVPSYKSGTDNDIVIPQKYDWWIDFVNGKIIVVDREGKSGVINSEGNVVVQPIYRKISVHRKNDKVFFLCDSTLADADGNILDRALYLLSDNFFVAKTEKNKYRILDYNGQLITEELFDLVHDFDTSTTIPPRNYYDGRQKIENQKYAIVCVGGLYGLIDRLGKLVVAPKYKSLTILENGCFWGDGVLYDVNEKRVVTNSNSVAFVPDDHVEAQLLDNGLILASSVNENGCPKWGCVNQVGTTIIPFIYSSLSYSDGFLLATICDDYYLESKAIYVQKNKKFGVINFKNEIIVPFSDEHEQIQIKENLILHKNKHNINLWGAYTRQGAIICEPIYKEIVPISQFALKVYKETGKNYQGRIYKWGVIDFAGNEILPFEYDSIADKPDNGLLKVQKNSRYGFIDVMGNMLLKPTYCSIGNFNHGYAIVSREEDFNQGVIDSKLNEVIPCHFSKMEYIEESHLFKTEKGYKDPLGRYHVESNGKEVLVPSRYSYCESFNNGYAIAVLNKNWYTECYGLINDKAADTLPPIFESLILLDNGLYKFKLNGKYGLIDNNGSIILPNKYHAIGEFAENLAWVQVNKNNLYGYIDSQGNEVLPTEYEFIGKRFSRRIVVMKGGEWWLFGMEDHKLTTFPGVAYLGPCVSDDLCKINIGGKYDKEKNRVTGGLWGYCSVDGKTVVEAVYESAYGFSEGLAAVKMNGKWGFINTSGEVVVPCKYDEVDSSYKDGSGRLTRGQDIFVFDSNGSLTECYTKEEEGDYYETYDDDTPSIYDNPYYNDNLDMDQQSIEFWNSL